MTLEAAVLRKEAVRAIPGGYDVDIHLPWYRSLPLSCVEGISISIGGKQTPGDQLRILYAGAELRLDELPELVNDWWFVQDALTVRVPDPSPLQPGTEAEASVHLATRIPYIIIAPGKALVQQTQVSNRVVIQ